jgi:hypothetical protein
MCGGGAYVPMVTGTGHTGRGDSSGGLSREERPPKEEDWESPFFLFSRFSLYIQRYIVEQACTGLSQLVPKQGSHLQLGAILVPLLPIQCDRASLPLTCAVFCAHSLRGPGYRPSKQYQLAHAPPHLPPARLCQQRRRCNLERAQQADYSELP